MVVQCCQCKKVKVSGTNVARPSWVDNRRVEFDPREVSHGYCPSCARKAFAEIHAYARNSELLASHA
jgi:hypothetical protein